MKKLITFAIILLAATALKSQPYWTQINSGTNKRLMSVSFGSPSVGYISGADSLLLKTTDGGHTWAPVNYTGLSFSLAATDIIHVNFLSATTGFAIVSNFENPVYLGSLFKTTDGGLSWAPVTTGNIAAYTTFFFDEDNGYEAGAAFFQGQTLLQLSNGSWGNDQNFNYDPASFLYTVDCYNHDIAITGGSGGYVYRTLNGGASWDTVKTSTDSTIHALRFLNDHTVLGACDNPMGGLIISTDTGRTWQNDNNTLTFLYPQLKALALSAKDSFIAVGKVNWQETGVILYWKNGFANADGAGHPLNAVAMSNDSAAFAVGDSGLIMSNLDQLINTVHPVAEAGAPSIYPNPSRGQFATEMNIDHQVRVYDIQGRLVCTDNTWSKHHRLDISGAPDGVYLLKLTPKQGRIRYEKLLIGKP